MAGVNANAIYANMQSRKPCLHRRVTSHKPSASNPSSKATGQGQSTTMPAGSGPTDNAQAKRRGRPILPLPCIARTDSTPSNQKAIQLLPSAKSLLLLPSPCSVPLGSRRQRQPAPSRVRESPNLSIFQSTAAATKGSPPPRLGGGWQVFGVAPGLDLAGFKSGRKTQVRAT